uniref:Zinc finger CW-type PWWP domain protein 1-like n=1 Tax=Schistosoma mansoni TaxID=6183 RepID=A0A5K4FEA9_SCHMA
MNVLGLPIKEPNISNFDKFVDEILDRISTIPLNILYENYFKYSKPEGNQSVTTNKVQYGETISYISNGNRKNNKKRSFIMSKGYVIGDADSTYCPRINIIEEQDLPGTWVECSFCSKWRYLPKVCDPSQLNDSWYCALNSKYFKTLTANSTINKYLHIPCGESEDLGAVRQEDEFIFQHFSVGSVVWAKTQGYPDWPAMVYYNSQGRYAEFDANSKEVTDYYIVFLGPRRSAKSKIQAKRIHKFSTFNEVDLSKIPERFWRRLQAAGQEAENALLLSVKASSQVKKLSRPYRKKLQTISNDVKQKGVYKRKIPPIHSCSINEISDRLIDCQLDANCNHTSNVILSSKENLSNIILEGDTNSHKGIPVSNHIFDDKHHQESNHVPLNNSSIEYQQLDISLKSNLSAKLNDTTFDMQYNTTDMNVDNDVIFDDDIISNTCQKMINNDQINSIDCYSPSFLKPIECDQLMKELICPIDICSNPNIETTDCQISNTECSGQNNLSIDHYEDNEPKSNLVGNQNYFKLTYNDLSIYSSNVTVNVNDILISSDHTNKNTIQQLSLNYNKKILYENIPFYYQYFGSNEP